MTPLLLLALLSPSQESPPEAAAAAAPAESAPAEPAPAAVVEEPSGEKLVAVLDLKVEGDAQALANAVVVVVASEVTSRPGMKAVARNELKALLSQQADAAMLGCTSDNCAADIAKLVDANLVITGTLSRIVGESAALVLTLSLLDPAGPTVVQRVDITWRGAPEEMVTAVPPAIDRLLEGAAAASYVGNLELFAPEGVTLSVDGKEVGKAPLKAAIRDLPIGVHRVQATGAGYVPLSKDVVVTRAGTSAVKLVLEEEPYYTQWWFWTAIGSGAAVAVAAGTTIGVVALLGEEPVPPTRVVVKAALPDTSTSDAE